MKKKLLLVSLLFVSLFVFVGCGSSNELVGTWKGLDDAESRDMQMETTFVFESNGNVTYSNEYGITGTGTYEINENKVTIEMDIWSKVYEFKVDGDKLSLIATDAYSPSYSELIKQ